MIVKYKNSTGASNSLIGKYYELTEAELGEVYDYIVTQTYKLKEEDIPHGDIIVSIPSYINQVLSKYLMEKSGFSSNSLSENPIAGLRTIPGYNNEICVFNSKDRPDIEREVYKIQITK